MHHARVQTGVTHLASETYENTMGSPTNPADADDGNTGGMVCPAPLT
jgi:hypothetical protein